MQSVVATWLNLLKVNGCEYFCQHCTPADAPLTSLFLIIYECCRVKSKAFNRFLLCSLLQTFLSPRFVSSSPSSSSSSCLLRLLVGWREQKHTTDCKSRFKTNLKKIFTLLEDFFLHVGGVRLVNSRWGWQWASWRCPDFGGGGHCCW